MLIFSDFTSLSSSKEQQFIETKTLGGLFEEHAIFSDILLGIRHVIQSHLHDVQHRFDEQLKSYETEIQYRDTVIHDLRQRLHDLGDDLSDRLLGITSTAGNGSTGSSGDIPFVVSNRNQFDFSYEQNYEYFCNFAKQRGDSLDTIFASSPVPSDSERESRIKAKTKKRSSPRKRHQLEPQESTDQETIEPKSHAKLSRKSSDVVIDDVTGNIAQLKDSVILNIGSSESSSSEHMDEDVGDIREDNDEDDDDGDGDEEPDDGTFHQLLLLSII